MEKMREKQQIFLSTLSVRRATNSPRPIASEHFISIHALREESDKIDRYDKDNAAIFLSTLSVRRAT